MEQQPEELWKVKGYGYKLTVTIRSNWSVPDSEETICIAFFCADDFALLSPTCHGL